MRLVLNVIFYVSRTSCQWRYLPREYPLANYGDGGDGWTWISSNPSPVSGSSAHQSNIASGMHQHYFTGATATMAVSTGDKLFAYVYLDPANMPSEVMLQWNDGTSWEHRAYWGTDSIAWGTNGTASRRHMGSLPPSGGWMRLEVSASLVGLEGQTVSGMAFTLYDGRATWDRAGKSAHPGGSINNLPFNVDASRNRLLPMSGVMDYDAAGNLSKDSYTTPWLGTRNYDAENRMVKTHDDQEELHSIYHYDGDGRRARRIINSVETWQIYGMGGELLAEYEAEGAANAPHKEYGYRSGQLLIVAESNGTVKWLVTDQLGTPRMVVDKSGDLGGANGIVRHDYLPFGEEISAGVGIRNSSSGYGTDTVRQKYTSYERDNETGLDFAQARYYANLQGRFTSVDPLMASAHVVNPQTWNRYSYSLNNPLVYTDPDGLKPVFKEYLDLTEDERRILENSKITVGKGKNAQTLSGQELYDYMKTRQQKQLANFLNQTAVLNSVKLENGRTALSYVNSISQFKQDRVIANVDSGLIGEVQKVASTDPKKEGIRYVGPEDSSKEHGIYDTSFRENRPKTSQQLSFASSLQFGGADIDIDEECPYCGSKGAAIKHAGRVVIHKITGGKTNPYKIYDQITTQRRIQPSYENKK